MTELDRLALSVINAGHSHTMIGIYLNKTSNAVTVRLNRLVKQGYLTKQGRGKYQLTTKGLQVVPSELPRLTIEITEAHRTILQALPQKQTEIHRQHNIPQNYISYCFAGLRILGYIKKNHTSYEITKAGKELLRNTEQTHVTQTDTQVKDPEDITIEYPTLPDGFLLIVTRRQSGKLAYLLTYRHITITFPSRLMAHVAADKIARANLPQATDPRKLKQWYSKWYHEISNIATLHDGSIARTTI